MNKILLLLCSMAFTGFADSGALSLEQALDLARQNAPSLRAARMQTRAAEQAVGASGLWMNPHLMFEVEEIGGDLGGFSDGEYTLGMKQTFALGGKRRGERDVAQNEVAIAFRKEAEVERQLLAAVRLAFVDVLAQQEIGNVRTEQEQLARAFLEVAMKRHEAGGASELDVLQAELLLDETILAQTCCFGDLAAAQERLASLIGIPIKSIGQLEGDYYGLEKLDPAGIAETHPALRRQAAEITTLRARAVLARAQDTADVTLIAGVRHEAADGNNSFVFGGSMPLTIVRRGRAQQAAMMSQADALAIEREELRRRLQQELSVTHALYSGALLEAEMVQGQLMPKAEKAYELGLAGYKAGRFSWFELIAGQQRLSDIRIRHIEALWDAHLARAELYKYMTEEI
jgi:cobalt-zinc-cadmium efflux system outer membrane protein